MITTRRISKAARKAVSRAILQLRAKTGARRDRTCSACNRNVVGFFAYGIPDWGCPECNASSRERLVNSCLNLGLLEIPSECDVLHIAPSEASLVRRFLDSGQVMFGDISPNLYAVEGVQRIDLMDMSSLGKFQLFYASHVMEHVPDDRKVLSNIYEHLLPGGQAWLLVPLHNAPTIDGPPDLSARERERRFGQWDHVRQYGMDLCDRLQDAGFDVSVIDTTQFQAGDAWQFGLWDGDKIFIGRRV